MRVVLTGGGTSGHIIPFEPIVESLRAHFLEVKSTLPARVDPEELDITFVGVADEQTKAFFAQYSVPVIPTSSGKLRRYASAQTIPDLLIRLPFGFLQALFHLWRIMPDVLVSKGGYGSVPVVLAAAFYRIPVLLHESDAVPGLANKKMLRLASAITVGFPQAKEALGKWQYKTFVTGTPVRNSLRMATPAEGKRTFEIPENEKVLLVTGGSQGAQQINEIILKILPELVPDMAVIHITGKNNYEAVSTVAQELISHSPRKNMYKAYPYLTDKMIHALAASDGIVSRAGSTLAEIAALRKPALLIPLANSGNDHQRKNAQAFEAAGAALVLDPINLGENIVKQNIERLMNDTEVRDALINNIQTLDFPHSGKQIAELTFKLASGFAPKKT